MDVDLKEAKVRLQIPVEMFDVRQWTWHVCILYAAAVISS